MAKADDTTSTIDWIWLRDALARAAEALGSKALAEKRLTEWLAAGKVRWSCVSWKGSEGRINVLPSATYCSGDRRFWSCHLEIDWQDNAAYEVHRDGAEASGIRVSRADLLALLPALLPEEPQREKALRQTKPTELESMEPKAWLAWARKEYQQQRNERHTSYIRRLHGLMQKAENVTEVWRFETFRVRFYEAVKADQKAVLKARKVPRTV